MNESQNIENNSTVMQFLDATQGSIKQRVKVQNLNNSEKEDQLEINKTDEYSIDWRDFIFLPFHPVWELTIIALLMTEILFVIYDSIYDHRNNYYVMQDIFLYCCEIMYFGDTVLYFIHKYLPRYRSIKEYPPKKSILLAVDVLSLLPVYETYFLFMATSRLQYPKWALRDIFQLRCLLRIYRIYEYFANLRYTAGVDQVLVTFTSHLFNVILTSHVSGAIWYTISCYGCARPNWTNYLGYTVFDADNPLHWLIICFTTIGKIVAHNTRGIVRNEAIYEALLILFVMLLGYIIHYIVFVGRLSGVYSKKFRRRFLFYMNLACIKEKLAELNIAQKWRIKTMDYYRVYWRKHQGIIRMPQIFERLPPNLQKEVTLDIFWEALRHSHLYGQEEISFRRVLSLNMKSEFYLAGDYIYALGKTKSKMVYIVSGILQVLTTEDEESPIMSFSSGTVLGEFSSLMPYQSNVYVRCATYCELHTLSVVDLFNVLKRYGGKTRSLQIKCLSRINYAKKMKRRANDFEGIVEDSYTSLEQNVDSSIKWIKFQWRRLLKLGEDRKAKLHEASYCHCSEFLDLLVLSQQVELKTKEICLRSKCPFILANNSSFIKFLHSIILAAVVLQCTILPFYIAFRTSMCQKMFAFCFFLDGIYFLDIYLKTSTIIEHSGRVESTVSKIILICFKRIRFMVDIIAVIPLDYAFAYFSSKYSTLLKVNRLLKVYLIFDYISKQERDIWLSNLTLTVLKYTVIYLISGYWLICFMYATTCFQMECRKYGWYLYNTELDKAVGIENQMKDYPFIETLFYVLFTYLRMGLSNKFVFIVNEMILHYLVVILGYFVFGFFFAQLCAMFILIREDQRIYQDYLDAMRHFLRYNQISKDLKIRIVAVLEFLWYYNKNKQAFGENGLLRDASPELSKEIETERRMKCISKVPLFSGLDEKLLSNIIDHCTVKTLPANFLVIEKGKRSIWLHVILRGYCKLVSTIPGDQERSATSILKQSDAFPVVEVLHQAPSQVSVTTATAVEIISLKYIDIRNVLYANRSIENEIKMALKEHNKTSRGLLLAGQERRMPKLIPKSRSLGIGDYFKFKIFDADFTSLDQRLYLAPFKKLGYFGVIRYFLRRNTVDPHGRFFITWEIFRCVFAIARILLVFGHTLILYENTEYFIVFLDFTAILDIYIRLHCQYHNDVGVLVTHPCSTALNYFQTAFTIDFVGIFPIELLRIHQILGYRNKAIVHHYLILLTRPLQLYRVVAALNYLQEDIGKQVSLIFATKIIIFGSFLIAGIALAIQTITCGVPLNRNGTLSLECNDNSWLYTTLMVDNPTVLLVFLKCVMAAMITFTSTFFGFFSTHRFGDTAMFLTLSLLLAILRWTIISIVLSFRVGGNVTLTIYQDQVKTFLRFVETEDIDEDLVNEVVAYYDYIWQSTKGGSIINTLNSLHANLHEEVVFSLYKHALGFVQILQGADETLLKELGTVMVFRHFKKDSAVIQCNDVQSNLYIVYKGKVNITVAGQRLSTLGSGGIFGCLKQQGQIRQTITATAAVHLVLLEINSNVFYNLVSVFPEIGQKLKRMNNLNEEYSEPRQVFTREPKKSVLKSSFVATRVISRIMMSTQKRFSFLIYHCNPFYQWWDYIICVHVAPLTSILIMVLTFVITDRSCPLFFIRIIIYSIDFIFIVKIFLEFHLTYVNEESGVTVYNLKRIRKKYVRSLWFYMSLIMVLPFEVITGNVTDSRVYFILSLLNRMIRFSFLLRYYYTCKDKINVNLNLRWTYLIYCAFASIQSATTLWWIAACSKGVCYYKSSYFHHQVVDIVAANPGIDSILLAYMYVLNLMTGTGLRSIAPLTVKEMLVTMVILCIFDATLVSLITVYTTILTIEQYSFDQYEYEILQLRSYLEARDLSKPIQQKVWTYTLQLWKRHRGESIPSIILEVPSYLKQRIMGVLYGQHLTNHFIFENTHVDFLRQLATHLIHCVFFPENYIVESGDKDACMYFIHEGEVEVYFKTGNTEGLHLILKQGESFGEASGLYNVAHRYSYKARTIVKVLCLKASNWKYLLKWFPASGQEIKSKANKHQLYMGFTSGSEF